MSHRHRGQRQDVKSRTMKYASLDPDIASKYDELDEDDNRLLRFQVSFQNFPIKTKLNLSLLARD